MNPIESASSPLGDAASPALTTFAVSPEKARRARSKFWLLAGLTAVVLVIAAVAGYLPRAQRRSALVVETHELAIPTVTVVSAIPGQGGIGLTQPAEVKPYAEATLYARANGYLKRWLVDIGAQVEAGQLLAEIDTPELNQQLAQGRAELAQAKAALDLARTTAARWTELLKTSSVSEQEAAEKKSDLALKSSTVEAAAANVRRLEEMQSFAKVTAPFAGVITSRRTDVGELIAAANGKELFRLAQTRTLRVFVRVPQSVAREVSTGQTAELTLPEMPGKIFAAKVVRTSGVMAPESRTLLVELEVDNAGGEIIAGSYARVKLAETKPDATLTLPSNVLIFRADGTQVGVVHEGGKVELRKINMGRDFGPTVEVLGGITTNDHVILNPSDSLTAGAVVRVADAKKETEK